MSSTNVREEVLTAALARIDCPRCRGFLREVGPAGVAFADEGRTIAFSGGSDAQLVAHFGGEPVEHDRTCPDCSRQVCLETGLSGRPVQDGRGRLEMEPGGLGPLADGCLTCAPIVLQAVAGPRHLVVSPETDRSFPRSARAVCLPLVLWGSIQARFRVSGSGTTARCDECGRGARLVRHWHRPVELGLRAVPGAARSRRPRLDCERCEGFVASAEFPEVVGAFVELPVDPELTYGPAAYRSPGRLSVSGWKCGVCSREVRVEEDPSGWIAKVALSRP